MSSFLSSLLAPAPSKAGPGDVRALLLDLLSPKQRAFVMDKHRFKIARCSRRAGKTYAIAAYMIWTCLGGPKTPVLYAGLTRDSAKEAVWDILITMLENLNIPHKASASTLQVLFPNGSKITVFGCDAQNARNRLRGRKFKLVCFDETGFYAALDPLVYAVLPMLADFGGTLCLTSSPGELLQGLFYEADQGKLKSKWSRYQWTIWDNPHFLQPADDPQYKCRAEEELAIILDGQFQGDAEHPGYKREWLGQWVDDDRALVYPVGEANLVVGALPRAEYAIGISLAAFVNSIVVGRYSEYSREFHFVEAQNLEDLKIDDVVRHLEIAMERYDTSTVVAYSEIYTSEIVDELRRRYKLPLTHLANRDKPFHQKIFANDLQAGYIRIDKKSGPLLSDCAKLVKNSDGEEIEGQPNYTANAALALYRRIYQTHLQSFTPPLTEEERHLKQLEESRDSDEPWFERHR